MKIEAYKTETFRHFLKKQKEEKKRMKHFVKAFYFSLFPLSVEKNGKKSFFFFYCRSDYQLCCLAKLLLFHFFSTVYWNKKQSSVSKSVKHIFKKLDNTLLYISIFVVIIAANCMSSKKKWKNFNLLFH